MPDDPKDVEHKVVKPIINSWTENDPPEDGLKRKQKAEKKPKSLHEVEHPHGSADNPQPPQK